MKEIFLKSSHTYIMVLENISKVEWLKLNLNNILCYISYLKTKIRIDFLSQFKNLKISKEQLQISIHF